MASIDAAVRWRGNGNSLKNVKVSAIQALVTRAAIDSGAIYFRAAGLGATAAANYLVQDCEVEARGDSAIMCDNTGPGGGTVSGCTINGQTFVGALPAQVHAFSSLALSCSILSETTIELPSSEYLVDVKVGSPILAVTGFVQASTTVSAINGNILTLNKTLLSGVGTTQTVTFTNIQFNIPNVARQLVVFQPANNAPVTFTNNIVNGLTGGGISYNTAVTCDVVGSTISGNTFEGEFGTLSYCLRVRGLNSVVSENINLNSEFPNAGFYILPNWSSGASVSLGAMIFNSSKYWVCILAHTSSSTNAPTGVDGALYWSEITLEQVNASGEYGVGLQIIGNNSNILEVLVSVTQSAQNQPIEVIMSKDLVKELPKVAQDLIFSDDTNWKLVSFIFKKVSSAQRLVSSFRDFDAEKSVKLKSGMLSGDEFQLHKLIISTPNRSLLVLKRSDIESAESFDFVLQ